MTRNMKSKHILWTAITACALVAVLYLGYRHVAGSVEFHKCEVCGKPTKLHVSYRSEKGETATSWYCDEHIKAAPSKIYRLGPGGTMSIGKAFWFEAALSTAMLTIWVIGFIYQDVMPYWLLIIPAPVTVLFIIFGVASDTIAIILTIITVGSLDLFFDITSRISGR